MDAVVIGSIAAVVMTIVVLVGFVGYWLTKLMQQPEKHSEHYSGQH